MTKFRETNIFSINDKGGFTEKYRHIVYSDELEETQEKIIDQVSKMIENSLENIPSMSETQRGVAKTGSGLEVTNDMLSLDLVDSASGTSVTAPDASYLESLTIEGKAVQNGTPTPSSPVPIEVVGPNGDDEFGIKVGNTLYPIDLQGNVLASLPDGTKDELTVDSAGHCALTKHTGNITIDGSSYSFKNLQTASGRYEFYGLNIVNWPGGIVSSNTNNYSNLASHVDNNRVATTGDISNKAIYWRIPSAIAESLGITTCASVNTWLQSNNMQLYFGVATPQIIDLGYIDPPAIPDGAAISITAQVTPTITASWWARGASAIATAIKALRDDLLARIEAIETAIADL